MESYNPYKRVRKTAIELYQEKLQKRNEAQDWIFGNSFGKPGGGAPLRDNNGNVISGLKSIADGNILKYDANDFSRGNNNITVLNHKIYNSSNIQQNNPINSLFNNNMYYNKQLQNNINFINKDQNQTIINDSINNKINFPNQKINNNTIDNNASLLNIYSPYKNIKNPSYLLVLPPSSQYSYPNNFNFNSFNTNNEIPQNPSNYNYNQNINNYYEQNNPTTYLGIDSKRKEDEKYKEMQQYRNELLSQIKDKKRKEEERKRKMEEDDKLEDIKNQEYFRIKKQQADEQARKLRERINRRMQKPINDEFGSSSHILEISKDFENANKSIQGESSLNNNNIEEIKESEENDENDFLNIEENLNGHDILLEEENYMKNIDDEFKIFQQTLINDIDKQINNNNNPNEINDYVKDKKIINKQKNLADYLLGEKIMPTSPIKYNRINPLSKSFSNKPKLQIKNDNGQILFSNTFKNKTINLEDFFNRDENKNENYKGINIKEAIQEKEAQDKIEEDYASIFKDLKIAHEYTKKYSKKDDDETTTSSFYSTSTRSKKQKKDNYQSQQKYFTKNNASRHNSSVSYSNLDKIKENKKDNLDNKENENLDENSSRTTGIKNISKTVLDKELINIQENKEDEEDEEDEQNQKNKQDKNIENNEENEDENINNEELENEEEEEKQQEENENINEEELENGD